MRILCALVLDREEWLVERVIYYAEKRGYTQYSSMLKEAWRKSVAGLSETIITTLRNYNSSLELSPDDDYARDPISTYGIKQALRHRERGINPGIFLGLFKYYRQSYMDLVKTAKFEPELSEFYNLFITRIFDRMEIGICLVLAHENEHKDYVGILRENNRKTYNEKNKYLNNCGSLPKPTILFNENNQVDYTSHDASIFFNISHIPGANCYHSRSARELVPWLDFITEGYADRLQTLVSNWAFAIGLPERRVVELRLLAQFHDIGKVGVTDQILFKPGPLTAEEFNEMKRHCEIGYRIAKSSPDLSHVADWILKHHEWWNGQGYPLGLKGTEIPLECRILAIVDAYDAMTSHRPYRKTMQHDDALNELQRCAAIQFDPQLVQSFVKVIEIEGFKTGKTYFNN